MGTSIDLLVAKSSGNRFLPPPENSVRSSGFINEETGTKYLEFEQEIRISPHVFSRRARLPFPGRNQAGGKRRRRVFREAEEPVGLVGQINQINLRRSKMITWGDSIEAGAKKAKEEKKLVLADFYNPQ